MLCVALHWIFDVVCPCLFSSVPALPIRPTLFGHGRSRSPREQIGHTLRNKLDLERVVAC